jgi:hypothetical protein
MTYVAADARQQLLDIVAEAVDEIGLALAALGAAYEQVDDHTADRLEEELFGPVQLAYGRAKRTYTDFAGRHGLPVRTFESRNAGAPSQGAKGFIQSAVDAAGQADRTLSSLQDSMLPVDVGDAELRAGLSDVRSLVGALPGRARELVRVLGR